MKASYTLIAFLAFGLSTQPFAQQVEPLFGHHPAVAAKRTQDAPAAGYDYASKFYPHPAWLYLSSEAPHPMMDHPAVIVAKRHKKEQAERAAQAAADAAVSASIH